MRKSAHQMPEVLAANPKRRKNNGTTSPFHSNSIGAASTAIAGGFLQVAVSKARKPICFVCASCIIALPIQR